jgi:hypothetical protein
MSNGGFSFPAGWPPNCPPDDAVDADIEVYRTVSADPPAATDFLSYHEEGKLVKNRQKICQAHGVSVYGSVEDAIHHRKVFGWASQRIAKGKLTPDQGRTKPTPGSLPSHITWWPYDGVNRCQPFVVVGI